MTMTMTSDVLSTCRHRVRKEVSAQSRPCTTGRWRNVCLSFLASVTSRRPSSCAYDKVGAQSARCAKQQQKRLHCSAVATTFGVLPALLWSKSRRRAARKQTSAVRCYLFMIFSFHFFFVISSLWRSARYFVLLLFYLCHSTRRCPCCAGFLCFLLARCRHTTVIFYILVATLFCIALFGLLSAASSTHCCCCCTLAFKNN